MFPRRSLKAGIPVSLSGQFRVQGRQTLAGLQAWADDVNDSGGLGGGRPGAAMPVSVIYYDDASQAEQARRITGRLITQDRVDLLFGPYSSVLSRAAAEVAEDHQRVLWNQGGASDEIYQQGYRWLVGVLAPASYYLTGLLPLVRQVDPLATTVGLLRVRPGAFAQAVTSTIERQAGPLGFKVVYVREFPSSLDDFSDVLEEIKDVSPQVLVVVGRISNDLQFTRQLVKTRLDLNAVAVVAAPIAQFREALGRGVKGFLGPSQWEAACAYPNDFGPSAQDVLKSFKRRGHDQVDYPMAQAYAAGLVAEKCVEQAGTLGDRSLREVACKLDFSTFYGRFRIDPDTGRQIGRSPLIVQWQRGRKVVVWPPEQRQAQLAYPWRRS